jgi:hypothetical protein
MSFLICRKSVKWWCLCPSGKCPVLLVLVCELCVTVVCSWCSSLQVLYYREVLGHNYELLHRNVKAAMRVQLTNVCMQLRKVRAPIITLHARTLSN